MKSLMDVAKSMDTQQAKPAEAGDSAFSLVDIAKKQNAAGDASGSGAEKKLMTLMDVARQESASAVDKTQQQPSTPTKSLASLAQEINDEDSKRIESALTITANIVKAEQRERQAAILKEAVAEVHQEEIRAALNLVAKIERTSKFAPPATAATRVTNAPKYQSNSISNQQNDTNEPGDDADGYSSFGDDDEEEEVPKKPLANFNKTKKKQQLFDEENGSDSGGNNGPERTIASDTPESKAFLRAVYRADLRKIQDMLDTEEVSAGIGDQHGWGGLHWAASQGHTKILEFLLKQGAQVNVVDHINGWTPLHVAAVREMLPCVKLLLQSGANTCIRDNYGDSATDILRAIRGKKRDKFLQMVQQFQAPSSA